MRASGPVGIAVAENGAVWFAEILADALGRVGRDGVLTEFPLPQGSKPHAIAADYRFYSYGDACLLFRPTG